VELNRKKSAREEKKAKAEAEKKKKASIEKAAAQATFFVPLYLSVQMTILTLVYVSEV